MSTQKRLARQSSYLDGLGIARALPQNAQALAASSAWRAAHAYPRQGHGWPLGDAEKAFEAVLLAVDAAGRERHDPRQFADSAEVEAANKAAKKAAAVSSAALFWAAQDMATITGHQSRIEAKAAIAAGIAAGVLSADGKPS